MNDEKLQKDLPACYVGRSSDDWNDTDVEEDAPVAFTWFVYDGTCY